MKDKYENFESLRSSRPNAFSIRNNELAGECLIFTPHGGGIEPGTSEICEWFNEDHPIYIFEGSGNNCRELHITSTRFDEPVLIKLLQSVNYAISFHGMTNYYSSRVGSDIFLGGLNESLIAITRKTLVNSGFSVSTNIEISNSKLGGKELPNVTNQCRSNMGMQVEISEKLRAKFFCGNFRHKVERRHKTKMLDQFCNSINNSILEYYSRTGVRSEI